MACPFHHSLCHVTALQNTTLRIENIYSIVARLQAHYETVVEEHGYDPIDFDLGDASASSLRRRFVAVDGRDAVAAALDRPTLVTTGVGMTGPPHLGTVGQILTAIRLQELGLDVQLVLADLEPYHGGADYREVRRLAERYRTFVRGLGFDPDQGTLRTMDEAHDVMHTAHLLARYYTPEEGEYWPDTEATEWMQALEAMYEDASDDGPDDDAADESGPSSEAAGAHSTLLHLADFLHPLVAGDYEQVVVVLGVDEHGLTLGTRRFARDAGVSGTIAGLHSRMITGLGEYPKMGKSVPESAITLDRPPAEIRDLLLADDGGPPEASMVCQAIRLASDYDDDRVAEIADACADGGESWERAKREYSGYVCELADRWQATAGVEVADPLD